MFHAPIFGFFYIWVSIFDKLKLISRLSFCQKSGIFTLHRSSFDKYLNSFDAYTSLLFASEASYILYVPLAHVSPVWFAQLHWLFPDFSIHKHAFLRFLDCLTSSFNKRFKSSSPRAHNAVFLSFSIKRFASSAIFECAFARSIPLLLMYSFKLCCIVVISVPVWYIAPLSPLFFVKAAFRSQTTLYKPAYEDVNFWNLFVDKSNSDHIWIFWLYSGILRFSTNFPTISSTDGVCLPLILQKKYVSAISCGDDLFNGVSNGVACRLILFRHF